MQFFSKAKDLVKPAYFAKEVVINKSYMKFLIHELEDSYFHCFSEFMELHQHTLFKSYLDHGMKTPGCDIKRALPSTFKVSSYETLWKHLDPDDLARWMEESR